MSNEFPNKTKQLNTRGGGDGGYVGGTNPRLNSFNTSVNTLVFLVSIHV